MCGFLGLISENRHLYDNKCNKALNYIKHRGPDDRYISKDTWCWLGFQRLSIIDLTIKGRQPMRYKYFQIVFNGEIYNASYLREELRKIGYKFISKSDTEVALKSYIEWGKECFQKFNGMWSIAIIDEKNRSISLFRDHLGIKPLYYSFCQIKGYFVFGSEIKSFKPFFQFEEEKNRLQEFFLFNSTLSNKTLIKGINTVLPNECVKFELKKNKILRSFIQNNYKKSKFIRGENLFNYFENLLIDSVKMRLVSDVNVGLQLSGGVDSSLIAAIIQTHFPKQLLNSYSISFENSELDESYFQNIVAKKYNIKHNNILFSSNDFDEYLDNSVWHNDVPIQHPSSVAMLKLSKVAKKDVTVLIGGEGADESFCGYPKYNLSRYDKLINFLTYFNPVSHLLIPKFKKLSLLKSLIKDQKNFEEVYINARRNNNLIKILNDQKDIGSKERINYLNVIKKSNLSILDQATSLRVLLNRFDKMTMAASIEGREPFCDYRLIAASNSLSIGDKIQNRQLKFIIKKIAEKYLPNDLIYRKKIGFSLPIGKWFRENKKLKNRLDILRSKSFLDKGLVDSKKFQKILDLQNYDNDEFEDLVWPLLSYEMWYQRFIKSL